MGKDHPMVGKKAPPIQLPAVPKGDLYTVPIGKKPIALFFFPKVFTAVCTKEACSFRDAQASNVTFKRHPELEVIGISGDDTSKQASFADQNRISYPFVSDVDGNTRKAYQVGGFLFGQVPGRSTFFIDHTGIIKGVCVNNMDFAAHAKFVEKMLLEYEVAKGQP